MISVTSYKKNNSKYSKCKYRGFHLFKGEVRQVRQIIKDMKEKKIIGKAFKKKATRKIVFKVKK